MKRTSINPFAQPLPRSLAARRQFYADYNAGFPNIYPRNAGKTGDWRKGFAQTRDKRYPSNGGTWNTLHTSGPMQGAYYCDKVPYGWRVVGDMGDILSGRNQATGYYTDSMQDGTYIGFVLQLPSRDGLPRYVPAIRHSDWDGITIFPRDYDVCDDKEDAARSADHIASYMAEDARDSDARDQSEQQIADAGETIARLRAERKALRKELRSHWPVLPPAIEATTKARIQELKDESKEAFEHIKALQDNYWLAVE